MFLEYFSRMLTLYLCGLTWYNKTSSINQHRTWYPRILDNAETYNGVKISIVTCDPTDLKYGNIPWKPFNRYKTQEPNLVYVHNLVCVYNFPASGNCTTDLLQQFKSVMRSCIRERFNMVIVFTCPDEMELLNTLKDHKNDKTCHVNEWLSVFSQPLAFMVRDNGIKCMFIKDRESNEFPGKYKQDLYSLCGLDI